MANSSIEKSPLSERSRYPSCYNSGILYPISRLDNRSQLISDPTTLPFQGYDLWHAYELSWLQPNGLPAAMIARFIIPANSPNLIESKSFKLYLNSLNNSTFENIKEVKSILEKDISTVLEAPAHVEFISPNQSTLQGTIQGTCLDQIDTLCQHYQPNPKLLTTQQPNISETVYTHLFRSNCPVTFQPDWATIIVHYQGQTIDHASLLSYLVSYRNHAQFHEHCVEMIFSDIMNHCQPQKLCIEAKFTRRGGLDINPIRANYPINNTQPNTIRQ